MKRMYSRPGKTLIQLCLLLASVALVFAFGQHKFGINVRVTEVFYAALIVFLGFAVVDYFSSLRKLPIDIKRQVPGSIAVDKWANMRLTVRHELRKTTKIEIVDLYSGDVSFDDAHYFVELVPGRTVTIKSRMRALSRGHLVLPGAQIRVNSIFHLWQSVYRIDFPVSTKVYPDFEAIVGYALLATDNHTSQLGIRKKPKRGEGMEFLQLREYRSGDTMRQIDWKATSRRQKLISKEYRDERDQNIIALIDSGRRMRARDDTLSHFDHVLNAALLLCYIALRQGDAVSAMSFGHMLRWIPAQKGMGNITKILNGMYDLNSGTESSDYVKAARELLLRQRKRSLVILMTNTRDEEASELISAVKLLRKHHLVLLANIHEKALNISVSQPVRTFSEALRYAAVTEYLKTRSDALEQIKSQGIYMVDCEPQQLPVVVANTYLAIKRAGIL